MSDLAELRRLAGLSQRDLAKRWGVAQATISRIENGQDPDGPMQILINQLRKELGRDAGAPTEVHHPLYGCMKGVIRIEPGTDLTEPADPHWADIGS